MSEQNMDGMNDDLNNNLNDGLNGFDEDSETGEDMFTNRMNLELESISFNQLNDLGNEAIKLGLIAGHGHHGGQYEVIHQGKIVTLAPSEAIAFLENLIKPSP
jgi:hypothetical protein